MAFWRFVLYFWYLEVISGGAWGHGMPDAALDAFCAQTIVFFCIIYCDRVFCAGQMNVTLTKYCQNQAEQRSTAAAANALWPPGGEETLGKS